MPKCILLYLTVWNTKVKLQLHVKTNLLLLQVSILEYKTMRCRECVDNTEDKT